MYYDGDGTQKDLKKAFYWCAKAAEQGNAEAQCRLAGMYYNGEGTLKDLQKSLSLYKEAERQGILKAEILFDLIRENGKGDEDGFKEAMETMNALSSTRQRLDMHMKEQRIINSDIPVAPVGKT